MTLSISTAIDWSQVITPIAVAITTAVIIPLILKVKSYIVGLVGKTTYEKAYNVGKGIFVDLENKYGTGEGLAKKNAMTETLKKLFPKLTDTELLAINKSVWATMDPIVKSLDEPASSANDTDETGTPVITTDKLDTSEALTEEVPADEAQKVDGSNSDLNKKAEEPATPTDESPSTSQTVVLNQGTADIK